MPTPAYSQYINKYVSPNNTEYWLRDEEARELISTLEKSTQWLGVTTTAISDGADWLDTTTTPYSVKPITVNGDNVTPMNGSIAQYSNGEYILTVTYDQNDNPSAAVWQEFGDLSSLGSLAYKNSASGSTTYTPAGTVSKPTFSGTKFVATASASGTAISVGAGTLSAALSGAPEISVSSAGSTTTIKNPSSKTVALTVAAAAPGQTAPSNAVTYMDVTDHKLRAYQLGYTTGASISTSNVTVKTGDASYSASQPNVTISGSPSGSVTSQPSVSLTFGDATASDTGTNTYTPAGSVSQPTFSGTQATISITAS